MSVFLSQILNSNLADDQANPVGKLTDMLVEPDELYLRVKHLVVRRGRERWCIGIGAMSAVGKGVVLQAEAEQWAFKPDQEDELLLARDILDAQVIDIHGAKVIRVNDVQLDQVDGRWIVSGLDIGAWGLCRRLGIAHWLRLASDTFKFHVPEGIVPWKEVAPLASGFRSLQLQVSSDQIERLHPADLADIMEELGHRERQHLLTTMTIEQTADLVEESDPSMQLAILKDLGDELAADVLEAMEPDDAADLLADVPKVDRDRLMEKMEPDEADELRRLMEWEEGTAGALMNTNFWSLPSDITRAQALDYFRSGIPVCEEVPHVYLLDSQDRFAGVLHLRKLLVADDATPVRELMEQELEGVPPEEAVAVVSRQMLHYQLLAMPVLDEERHLLGVVTIYDVMEHLFEN